MKLIVFRADASIKTGTGHVMRCLSLAESLKAKKAECFFICRDLPGHLGKTIRKKGFKLYLLPGKEDFSMEDDARESLLLVKKLKADCLIVDHYKIDAEWEKNFRNDLKKIVVIDDLADRKHECDILLDSGEKKDKHPYKGLIPEKCIVLSGSDFLILRDEFIKNREASLKSRSKRNLKRIMISMGGTDPDNFTAQVIEELEKSSISRKVRLDIIMGKKAPFLKEIIKKTKNISFKSKIYLSSDKMAKLMSKADLAIGAAGSTSLERCYMGLPSIIFIIADNQREIAGLLERREAAWLIKDRRELSGLIDKIQENPELLHRQSLKASELINKAGNKKICKYILS